MQKRDNTQYGIRAIVRAAQVLRCLADGETKVTDIAKRLQLSKATVFRVLQTLEMTGFAMQDIVTKEYCVGSLIYRLASTTMVAHQELILCADKEMERLSNVTKETVTLAVQSATQVMCLKEVVSQEHMRFSGGTGATLPLYYGSTGKIILSELPDNELRMIKKYFESTVKDAKGLANLAKLDADLKEIRAKGYSTSHSEVLPGVTGISIPIKGYVCPVVLNVIGPEGRFGLNMLNYLPELKKSAERISKSFNRFHS